MKQKLICHLPNGKRLIGGSMVRSIALIAFKTLFEAGPKGPDFSYTIEYHRDLFFF
jgi:hypothetical protein